MSMSLTISQPTKTEFGTHKLFTHEFNSRLSRTASRSSPKSQIASPSPVSSLRVSALPADSKMSNHPHRGLPPPSAMALPDPRRDNHPLNQPLGAMPAPPSQWQGQEESMRSWLAAKAEEDKRKQEEERTRQETLKLEQRKIEQSMLRESLQGGIPAPMVPMIYAGIGGANLANVSMDWLHQYAGQLQVVQEQLQHRSAPDASRDQGRLIGPPPQSYAFSNQSSQQPPPPPPQQQHPVQQTMSRQQSEQPPPPSGPMQTTFSQFSPLVRPHPQPTSDPRSATHAQLPKLTTNVMYVQNPSQLGGVNTQPPHQGQVYPQQEGAPSPPSIYFHHWVPPSEVKAGPQPQTPASKGEPQSAHNSSSSLRDTEYRESPRKRKAQGGHEPNPPPSGGPQYTSPPFSVTSSNSGRRVGHLRSQSNASIVGRDLESRPLSRGPLSGPRQPDSGNTNTSMASNTTNDSSQLPSTRLRDVPRSLTEAIPRETRSQLPRPGSR